MEEQIHIHLGAVEAVTVKEARLYAHYAVQWLARAARAYVPTLPDDSHTSLSWLPNSQTLVTQELPSGDKLGLIFSDLAFVVAGPEGPRDIIELDGLTDAEAGGWIAEQIETMGLDPDGLTKPLPYGLPEHALAKEGAYEAIDSAVGLRELASWYGCAHSLLLKITEQFEEIQPGPSPVHCWPHHFDIATLISFERGNPETARSIGVGLSPGDETYNEPYFYVNPWPHLDPKRLPVLPSIGEWQTQNFVGAIAKASRIAQFEDQEAEIIEFLKTAIAIGRMGLSV